MAHTDTTLNIALQSTSPFTTTRRQQEEPYIVQELRPIYIQKISVVVFFNSFLNFNKKSKISGVNELTGSTSHRRRENYMSNEFSELGGECTYLISSSHLSLILVVLSFECGECCFLFSCCPLLFLKLLWKIFFLGKLCLKRYKNQLNAYEERDELT